MRWLRHHRKQSKTLYQVNAFFSSLSLSFLKNAILTIKLEYIIDIVDIKSWLMDYHQILLLALVECYVYLFTHI